MTWREALKNGYVIVVSNGVVAQELNKRFKTNKFASVNSSPYRFDGVKGIYIDQFISNHKKAIELQEKHMNVFVGPLNLKPDR